MILRSWIDYDMSIFESMCYYLESYYMILWERSEVGGEKENECLGGYEILLLKTFCVVEFPHGLSKIQGSPHVHKFRECMPFRWRTLTKWSYRVSGLETMSITRWLTKEENPFEGDVRYGKRVESILYSCIFDMLCCLFAYVWWCVISILTSPTKCCSPLYQTHCRWGSWSVGNKAFKFFFCKIELE